MGNAGKFIMLSVFSMTTVKKKRTAQTYGLVLKYFRFTSDLQTTLDLKVRVDNHLKAIETEQSGTFSSKFSKYILLFFNFYVTPNFARVYEIRISSQIKYSRTR